MGEAKSQDLASELFNAEIGIALSGGGHRATAFSLGSMLALADIQHNKRVSVIASVSGGSIASGFFAVMKTPYCVMTTEQVERAVSALAVQLAGSPRRLAAGFAAIVLADAAWIFGYLSHLDWSRHWVSPFAFSLAGALGAFRVVGQFGGTLWAWWGTWVYAGLFFPILASILFLPFDGIAWYAAALLLITVGLVLAGLRNVVAGMAIDKAMQLAADHPVLGEARAQTLGRELRDVASTPLHVFCTTEMHTGRHAYFSKDFVYAGGFGLGTPSRMKLRTAVQASANFPGGFPPRFIHARRFQFRYGPKPLQSSWMILTDGGVYDNMGTAWFRESGHRRGTLLAALGEDERIDLNEPAWKPVAETEWQTPWWQHKKVGRATLVLNAAPPFRWRKRAAFWLPGFGELWAFLAVTLSMYNNILHGRYDVAEYDPTVLDYKAETPETLLLDIASSPFDGIDQWWDHDRFGWSARPLAQYLAVGDPNQSLLHEIPAAIRDEWQTLALRNARVGTHLNPLGVMTTAELMRHAYVLTVVNLHLFFHTPLVDRIPGIEEFQAIARGQIRAIRPRCWIPREGGSYRREA